MRKVVAGMCAGLLTMAMVMVAPDAQAGQRKVKTNFSAAGGFSSRKFDPRYLPKTVTYITDEKPGTIIINTRQKYLYLVQGNGKALRYGVGVGRQGFTWSGVATIGAMRKFPDWYPPKEMIERELKQYGRRLPEKIEGGDPKNPLGIRALYLYQNGRDTLYRIHGTNEPWTIGRNVSSGCIRMRNKDVADLFDRVRKGAKVIVK
ncbi:MAG TPA: L,D-transpeptidase [Thermopetrobacter sp.]|nr:L,D-transpeptidase [Thermopetrobacter sp.]